MTTHTGGCACGAIRFEIDEPFMMQGACHCADCQKTSGGGANYVVLAPKGALRVTKGEAKLFTSKGDSGGDVNRAFCPDCGTPLWSIPAEAPFMTVKVGAFDNLPNYKPQMHIYTASAPAWHTFTPDAARIEGMPQMG